MPQNFTEIWLGSPGMGEEGGLNGQVGDVVGDAHGEVVVPLPGQVLEDGVHVRRGGVLGGQAVPAADDPDLMEVHLVQGGRHIQVEGSPKAPGSLVRSSTARRWRVSGSSASRWREEKGR